MVTDWTYHGRNGGQNAGRYCWKVAGTFCGGEVQGSFASKMMNCALCDVFKQIKAEGGASFIAQANAALKRGFLTDLPASKSP